MADAPLIPPGGPLDDCEQTTQIRLPDVWLWPDRDPDEQRADVVDEARTALHQHDPPTLPILESVLAGLHRLVT